MTDDCPYCVASHREQLVERVGLPGADAEALARGEFERFDGRERAAAVAANAIADALGIHPSDREEPFR